MAPVTTKAIHPDIPTERAWQVGRRIYVRCAYQSKLNEQLRGIGARWDAEVHTLWVGTGKLDRLLPLVQAAEARRVEVDQIKTAGHTLVIPYDAYNIRSRAKELGGIWDDARKQWAMPTDEAYTEVRDLRDQWQTARDTERQELRDAERQARHRAAAAAEADERKATETREQEVLSACGRTLTGETVEYTEVCTRVMNKATARQTALPTGTVVKLGDGKRGIITRVKIWFTNEDMASSVCWHPQTHDEAHWDFRYTAMVVEPTAEEVAADTELAEKQRDALDIHRVVRDAPKQTGARAEDRWTAIPDAERVGTIEVTTGIATIIRGGHLILTTDGRVVWQHPGYYDDYVRSEGITTNPDLVAAVRALLDRGPRSRTVSGQLPTRYEVTVTDA